MKNNSTSVFCIGQRFMSENEPELGMGYIKEVHHKRITVEFEASEETRLYSSLTAPLKRVLYHEGDTIQSREGFSLTIEDIEFKNNLYFYYGQGKIIPESELSANLRFNKPEDRFFHGQSDPLKHFYLRMDTWKLYEKILTHPYRGFIGAKVSLIPHQYSIAQEVSQRPFPRVLLSDEVGLGKTIEAALILHRLLTTGRVQKVLILTPSALVYQWFTELYRKFQLKFRAIQEDDLGEEHKSDELYSESQQFILSQSFLFKDTKTAQSVLSQKWDLIIIDEAHRIPYQEGAVNAEYQIIQALSQKTQGLILLSATPEHLGKEGHYSRLKLLDPHRYHSFNQFLEDEKNYATIATIAQELTDKKTLSKESIHYLKTKLHLNMSDEFLKKLKSESNRTKLIQILIDHYGTSRSVFRNTRKRIDQDLKLFPKRKVFEHACKNEDDKIKKIIDFLLKKKPNEKILLIASTKELALKIEKSVTHFKIKAALFHEHMTLVQRDRQAAYFTDEEGARVLICSEIGSEGRNFQCAHTLILFDLPKEYEILEQRIGRLDRIGQKNDIHIHSFFTEKSDEEKLFRFYHEALHAFENSSASAAVTQKNLFQEYESCKPSQMNAFIKKAKKLNESINNDLEAGRNRLIELNSFHPEKAAHILQEIQKTEENPELKNYMEKIFSFFGVTEEEHNEFTSYIHPGDHMFTSHFPFLTEDGLTLTYSRSIALERDPYHYMSIDHPMVMGVMDFILGKEHGNAVIAGWKSGLPERISEKIYMEVFYVCDSIAPLTLQPQNYLPPSLIRVLVDPKGKDCTLEFSFSKLNEYTIDADDEKKAMLRDLPKELFQKALLKSLECAQKQLPQFIQKALTQLNQEIDHEIQRLKALQKINSSVTESEIESFVHKKKILTQAFQSTSLRLDSIRFIM